MSVSARSPNPFPAIEEVLALFDSEAPLKSAIQITPSVANNKKSHLTLPTSHSSPLHQTGSHILQPNKTQGQTHVEPVSNGYNSRSNQNHFLTSVSFHDTSDILVGQGKGIQDCYDKSSICPMLLQKSLCHDEDVKLACPFSCQACEQILQLSDCSDRFPSDECNRLAVTGKCNDTNIVPYCLRSCGKCAQGQKEVNCFDRLDACPALAADSWCLLTQTFMSNLCPHSCQICS